MHCQGREEVARWRRHLVQFNLSDAGTAGESRTVHRGKRRRYAHLLKVWHIAEGIGVNTFHTIRETQESALGVATAIV